MSAPDLAIATQVATALSLTLGVDVFTGPSRQVQTGVSSQAIFCHLYGGYDTPMRYMQGNFAEAGAGLQAREPRVVVTVRGPRQNYAAGQALARQAKDAIHDKPPAGYDACRVVEAEPIFLSQTNEAEMIFSFNVHLWLDENLG